MHTLLIPSSLSCHEERKLCGTDTLVFIDVYLDVYVWMPTCACVRALTSLLQWCRAATSQTKQDASTGVPKPVT